MTSPLTVGLNDLLERLGQKSGLLPDLAGGVQPVFVYGDLSATLATERLEARAQFTWQEEALPADEAGQVILVSRAPGGCVVEHVAFRVDPKGNSQPIVFEIDPPPSTIGEFVPQVVQIGGVDTVSLIQYIRSPGAVIQGAGWPVAQFPEISIYPTHIYVPPGSTLRMGLSKELVAGRRFDGYLVWREMTAIPGRA